MKKSILAVLLTLCSMAYSYAQPGKNDPVVEKEVRKLDSLHAAAVLSGDLKEMDKYWTEDFMVTNPFNEIDRADRIRSGAVTYASFQRIAETVKIQWKIVHAILAWSS